MNEKIATRIIFFIAGLATSAWAVMVPFAKLNTDVNDALLGVLLLCLGCGAIISMPLAGPLSSRFGCRKIIGYSVIIIILSLPLLILTNNSLLLGFILFIFGVGVGVTDCTMNIQAILVEKNENMPLMSGFHGMYSVGGIIGAGLMTMMLTMNLTVFIASLFISIIIFLLFLISFKWLLSYASPKEGASFAIPKGGVLLFGVICFIVFLAEGTILDWSAVYLVDVIHVADSQGGLGFTCFAVAMSAGRLTGDAIIKHFGHLHVVIVGTLLAFLGFILIIMSTSLWIILFGYLLIGVGCSNIAPVMFSQIGKQKSMPQMVAVPAVTTMGYLGVLAGPALIGMIAHQSSLSYAFAFVAGLMLFVLGLCIFLNKNMKRNLI